MVEAQHLTSTLRLVDSAEDQALLEELIDGAKPPAPTALAFKGLHYLLSTPFRHPPLRHGSRFGTREEGGIFYASDALATAFAETAYYRFLFLAGTRAVLPRLAVELSAFRIPVRTARGVNLTRAPFDRYPQQLRSRTRYTATQLLGKQMRADGVEAFRYHSARDPDSGTNVGVFTPRAFTRKAPKEIHTWLCDLRPGRVEFTRKNVLARPEHYAFERKQFEVRGELPQPAV